ncbi:hypothetical protein AB0M97_16310 [Streptomyces sp. NPDC051207]
MRGDDVHRTVRGPQTAHVTTYAVLRRVDRPMAGQEGSTAGQV